MTFCWAEIRHPLRLRCCRLPDAVLLSDASGKEVVLERCVLLRGLDADRLRLQGGLDLTESVITGELRLGGGTIGGDLVCAGTILRG